MFRKRMNNIILRRTRTISSLVKIEGAWIFSHEADINFRNSWFLIDRFPQWSIIIVVIFISYLIILLRSEREFRRETLSSKLRREFTWFFINYHLAILLIFFHSIQKETSKISSSCWTFIFFIYGICVGVMQVLFWLRLEYFGEFWWTRVLFLVIILN